MPYRERFTTYHFDKDGLRHLASASTRCKTCVSNARLTLLPDCQRTCPGHSAKASQRGCAQIIQSQAFPPTCFASVFCGWPGAVSRRWLKPPSDAATTPDAKVVGLGGLEPPTSPLSGVRSNHLSYRPNAYYDFPDKPLGLSWKVRTWMCGLLRGTRTQWWSLSGSNRRPPACKAGALPAELQPRVSWWVWMDSNHRPPPYQDGALTN